ncbi:hypothetical protein [Acetobacter sp.]|uniref:hypothetical protein n=1 Tax=Acetobacter sp. TaxID=440 RepID=UPI0025C356DF|nr:hypothetical protein [Acetobacter sp.]MCH4090230.1 hypothetical protein [Acetobacter sp.]MCI1298924.1 hypothetical protein [Acetobacter sp.]MCI1314944.1 hypothetical protein [Acetobacter sp.]
MNRISLSSALAVLLTVAPAQAEPAVAGKAPSTTSSSPQKLSSETKKAALVAQLAASKNPTEAALLRGQLEELRTQSIRPATRLLMRRAARELASEKPGDAVEDFGAALSLQNDVAVLWRLRAQARILGGDPGGAISDLGVALQHDGSDAVSWQLLTAAEDVAGDGQAALKAWQRVMELDPQLPGAAKRFEKLQLKAFGRPT